MSYSFVQLATTLCIYIVSVIPKYCELYKYLLKPYERL